MKMQKPSHQTWEKSTGRKRGNRLLSFNPFDIGQVQTLDYDIYNTGNAVLNMNFESYSSNLTIRTPTVSINPGSQSSIDFSYRFI